MSASYEAMQQKLKQLNIAKGIGRVTVVDTDVGTDNDDTIALLRLIFAVLQQAEEKSQDDLIILTGEEVLNKNGDGLRALLAKKIIQLCGAEKLLDSGKIKIYRGLVNDNFKDSLYPEKFIAGTTNKGILTLEDNLDRFVGTLNQYNYVNYLSIQSLNNLNLILKHVEKESFEKMDLLKKFHCTLMGGRILKVRENRKAEHNIRLGVPAAANIVSHQANFASLKFIIVDTTTSDAAMSITLAHPIYDWVGNCNPELKTLMVEQFKNFLAKYPYPDFYPHDDIATCERETTPPLQGQYCNYQVFPLAISIEGFFLDMSDAPTLFAVLERRIRVQLNENTIFSVRGKDIDDIQNFPWPKVYCSTSMNVGAYLRDQEAMLSSLSHLIKEKAPAESRLDVQKEAPVVDESVERASSQFRH